MSIGKHWMYHADALPEFAQKLVRLNDGKAERYTARDGWVDAEGVQAEVKWTGDWDPVWGDDVGIAIQNIRNPKPRAEFDAQSPSWRLRVLFGAYLDAIEAGLVSADQIPLESGLNAEVISAFKVVEHWDVSDEWRWCNTPVDERGEYPILQAYFALGAQCRTIDGDDVD